MKAQIFTVRLPIVMLEKITNEADAQMSSKGRIIKIAVDNYFKRKKNPDK